MRKFLLLLSVLCLSCSSQKKEEKLWNSKPPGFENAFETVPFEKLPPVRMFVSLFSSHIDKQQVKQAIIDQFKKIGDVYAEQTPPENWAEKQAKEKLAVSTFSIMDIQSFNYGKTLPVIGCSFLLQEEAILVSNQKPCAPIVWTRQEYVDASLASKQIPEVVEKIVSQFGQAYVGANAPETKPSFYISFIE